MLSKLPSDAHRFRNNAVGSKSKSPFAAINGIRLFFFPTRPLIEPLDSEKPVAPVIATAGIKMNRPGMAIKLFTCAMDSAERKSSAMRVELKNVTMHEKAVMAPILWRSRFISFTLVLA